MFVDQSSNDFHLQAGSPCIGTGRFSDDRGALPFQTGICDNDILPNNILILANYPNPFNSSTLISYNLTHSTEVTIDIYDMLGRRIETLLKSFKPAGSHSIIWSAEGFSSGIYFYKLTANESENIGKMILIK